MITWKGLILAGGTGSRLDPVTRSVNKHLLPVYDKPMVFYPLTTLMFAGVRDIIVITTPSAIDQFQSLLGDGGQWGLSLTYLAQACPGGIAEGFKIAKTYLAGHHVALILGDNIFYGSGLGASLRAAARETVGATIFSYEVADPSAFGVVVFDDDGKPVALAEKPTTFVSRSAVTGLYFYTPDVVDITDRLAPSDRGELEITDVNQVYLDQGRLQVCPLGRGIAWLDGGTSEDLFEASQFVKILEDRTGLKISCPEEIALRLGYISPPKFAATLETMPMSSYRRYLEKLCPPER